MVAEITVMRANFIIAVPERQIRPLRRDNYLQKRDVPVIKQNDM
jgi:hypothetical protein